MRIRSFSQYWHKKEPGFKGMLDFRKLATNFSFLVFGEVISKILTLLLLPCLQGPLALKNLDILNLF